MQLLHGYYKYDYQDREIAIITTIEIFGKNTQIEKS